MRKHMMLHHRAWHTHTRFRTVAALREVNQVGSLQAPCVRGLRLSPVVRLSAEARREGCEDPGVVGAGTGLGWPAATPWKAVVYTRHDGLTAARRAVVPHRPEPKALPRREQRRLRGQRVLTRYALRSLLATPPLQPRRASTIRRRAGCSSRTLSAIMVDQLSEYRRSLDTEAAALTADLDYAH